MNCWKGFDLALGGVVLWRSADVTVPGDRAQRRGERRGSEEN